MKKRKSVSLTLGRGEKSRKGGLTESEKKRRKSFCARMEGMPGPLKDKKGRPTRKALALKRWRC